MFLSITPLAVSAQDLPTPPRPAPLPASPVIEDDGSVTFRIRAPEAESVTITGDVRQGLPDDGSAPVFPPPPTLVLERGADGVWEGNTEEAVAPGAYRYRISLDGVEVVDPANTQTSYNQTSTHSLIVVPGDFAETRSVPHGLVSEVTYTAPTYGPDVQRSVYVYTPPGYGTSDRDYPVLYLIHGGGDTANSWMTVGRANNILDNLAAQGAIEPFILVALNGWTPEGPQPFVISVDDDPLNAELTQTIIPMIEERFRVIADPAHRAISGLSMGGLQTLNIGIHNVELWDYILPMSTGFFTDEQTEAFIANNVEQLAKIDEETTLFWWGWGETDIARENGINAMRVLREAGLTEVETFETEGGHDWRAWRAMLHEYAPRLFR